MSETENRTSQQIGAGKESGPKPRTNASWIFASPRRAALRTRIFQGLFAVALALYAVLAFLAHRFAYFSWDLSLAHRIQSIDVPGFYSIMSAVSVLGSGWEPFALTLSAGAVLLMARRRAEAFVCVLGTGLGSGLDQVLKGLSDRPRPPSGLVHVLGSYHFESFPSGHVIFFVDFFGFLLFVTWAIFKPFRGRTILMVLFVFLISIIGVSRVYLGAHWPSDVAGAYLAGGLWLTVIVETSRRLAARYDSAMSGS
ncbi:MAG: phosphatase PAP2 family protein [Blastocatellia bacterium]